MAAIEILSEQITVDREVVSGAPTFSGTRVPVRSLFDFLEGGESIERFLSNFPSVKREQVEALLSDISTSLQEIADRPYATLK